jgi:hypothetical protein
MINLVMFHSGQFPIFLEYNFKQIRLFNPEINVYFLTDKEFLDYDIFKKYNIKALNKDGFYSDKIKEFESKFNFNPSNFWTIAATRLIYIENFLEKYNLENVYHFENDVLLYYNLENHHDKFINLYNNMAITTGGPDKSMTGFMFIKKSESLKDMTRFFIDKLSEYGVFGLMQKYKMDMVHEMSLMKVYNLEKGQEYLADLPILPFSEYSKNFNDFNSIFDPATWGQFVGGTRVEGPGAKPQDHYIGVLLNRNPSWSVVWKNENKLNVPYFDKYGELFKINNLHIHSKNLNKYISKI